MPIANYGMLKGNLVLGVPYYSSYRANPHYVFVLDVGGGKEATIVVNSMSSDGTEVGVHSDFNFEHPMLAQMAAANPGFPTTFPRLDYQRDFRLVGGSEWTPIPYEDDGAGGSKHDINDLLSGLAQVVIDPKVNPPVNYPFDNGQKVQNRQGFKPSGAVTVVAFGQTFPGGVHDAHMSQGERAKTKFAGDNGIHQDGAIFFFVDNAVRAHFTVFSSQYLPTDSRGFPLPGAIAACPKIEER